MNILELQDVVNVLIKQGKGEAKLYVNDGGAGVADEASIYDYTQVVGEDTEYLEGGILEEEDGTEVVFIHYN